MGTLTALAAIAVALVTPCAAEDSDNCYWDAGTAGNGAGMSFVTVNNVTYYPNGDVIAW